MISCLSSIKKRFLEYGSNTVSVQGSDIYGCSRRQNFEDSMACVLVVFWLDSAIDRVEDVFKLYKLYKSNTFCLIQVILFTN